MRYNTSFIFTIHYLLSTFNFLLSIFASPLPDHLPNTSWLDLVYGCTRSLPPDCVGSPLSERALKSLRSPISFFHFSLFTLHFSLFIIYCPLSIFYFQFSTFNFPLSSSPFQSFQTFCIDGVGGDMVEYIHKCERRKYD